MKRILVKTGILVGLIISGAGLVSTWGQTVGSDSGRIQPRSTLPGVAPAGAQPAASLARPSNDSDIKADKLEYVNKTIVGVGNVYIRRGGETLTADYVTYDTIRDVATARGNVHFDDTDTGRVWDGDELVYDFRRKEGDFGTSQIYSPPFTVTSSASRQINQGLQELDDIMVTTCIPEDPEFNITATRAMVFDETIVRSENAVFWLNGLPILYLPRYTVDLERDTTRFDVLPGYSSRHGAYLLTAYSIPLNEYLTAVTHLDYRSERGLGIGEDLRWYSKEDYWKGAIRGYYINDDAPYKSPEQEEAQRADGLNIDDARYRVRFSHFQPLADNDMIFAELGKVSDPEVVLDFFDEEHRTMPQPENRVSYIHSDELFSAGLDLHKNLNEEFFSGVNRLPEAYLNAPRLRIMDSPFYYEGFHSAGQLEATFSDYDKERRGRFDYDTQRIHTENTIYYPTRHFGWLNIIPRVGYKGTFYGETFAPASVTNVTSSINDAGFSVTSTNVVNDIEYLGADTRNLLELGVESSFKAFKELHNDPTTMGVGLRHVAEPFVNYTLIPEQDLRPTNILQFDQIDRLDRRNDITFGMRNKLQTKRPVSRPDPANPGQMENYNQLVDIIDLSVSTSYLLEPEENETELGLINIDGEFRPADWMVLDVRAGYNTDLSEFDRVYSQLQFYAPDRSYIAFDHYFRPDRNHVLQTEYSLWPENTISLDGYTRYEILQGEFEEQSLLATYKTDCVGYGIGVRWIAGEIIAADSTIEDEDEWQAWFQIWLTAFPNGLLELGR
jgi:LPS-assembly protein